MLEKGIKDKTLDELKAIILEVASIHVTLHDRCLDFLRTKKESLSYSDFLRMLEEKIDLTNYQNWSRDWLVRSLFLTFCDVEMGKIVTALLSNETINMAEMRTQLRNLEASPWYKGNKATAKLAGGTGTGLGASGS